MGAGNTNEAVQMLDLLLEFFADGAHWTRGRYHDGHGRRCLIGALNYLRRKHHVPSDTAVYYLREADYDGEWCPVCEFWHGRDRFTGQRVH